MLDLAAVPIGGGETTDMTGEPQVWIAFVFVSNGTVGFAEGSHVDDVTLCKYVPGP